MKDRYILAFETSCDETSVAVLKNDDQLLSNVIASQIESHKRFGGVVPEVASRHHVEVITACIEEALEEAGITEADVTAVAVTYGPGLVGALLVGLAAAKAFAWAHGLPLIPVNHMAGHLMAAQSVEPLEFPLLALLVSGGHTELVYVSEAGDYKIVGETRDDAVGEAYDKVGRVMGFLLEASAKQCGQYTANVLRAFTPPRERGRILGRRQCGLLGSACCCGRRASARLALGVVDRQGIEEGHYVASHQLLHVFRRRAAVVVFQEFFESLVQERLHQGQLELRVDILIREHFLKRLHGGSFRADRFCCGDSIDPRRPDVGSFRASGPRSAPERLAIGPRLTRRRSGGELQKFGELAPASTRWGTRGWRGLAEIARYARF